MPFEDKLCVLHVLIPMHTGPVSLVPPVLTSFSRSNRDVVLGEDLVVSCSAEGRPVPAIVWQMNSTVLTSGGDVLISNTSNERSELRIRNFTRSNSGQYSCTATNTFGNISASFRVNLIIGEEGFM